MPTGRRSLSAGIPPSLQLPAGAAGLALSRPVAPFPCPRHSDSGLARSLQPGFIPVWSKPNALSCNSAGGRACFSLGGSSRLAGKWGLGDAEIHLFLVLAPRGDWRALCCQQRRDVILEQHQQTLLLQSSSLCPSCRDCPGLDHGQVGMGKGSPLPATARDWFTRVPCQHGPHPCPGHGRGTAEAAADAGTYRHGQGQLLGPQYANVDLHVQTLAN